MDRHPAPLPPFGGSLAMPSLRLAEHRIAEEQKGNKLCGCMGTAQGKILQGLRPLLQAPSGLHYVFVCENQALNAKVDQGQRMSVSNVDAAYIKANLLSMNCLVQSMGDRADI